jgi:hypothetical protein
MKESEIKYYYTIHSTIDLDEILESIIRQLKSEEGEVESFPSPSKVVRDFLGAEELTKKAMELFGDGIYFVVKFRGVEILVEEDVIGIESKVKLDLSDFDDVEMR